MRERGREQNRKDGVGHEERRQVIARRVSRAPVRQRDAVRLLTEQVGPMAEAVAIRMERALSADELRAAVLQGGRIIANIRGQKAAEAYLACFADL